jgi:hypothetical protein
VLWKNGGKTVENTERRWTTLSSYKIYQVNLNHSILDVNILFWVVCLQLNYIRTFEIKCWCPWTLIFIRLCDKLQPPIGFEWWPFHLSWMTVCRGLSFHILSWFYHRRILYLIPLLLEQKTRYG